MDRKRKNIGFAFGEHVSLEKTSNRHFDHDYQAPKGDMRGFLLLFFLVSGSLILIIRLFFLSVVEGSYYKNLSDNNRIRTKTIHAPRGIIFDRNQKPLVFNIPGFRKIEKASKDLKKTTLLGKDEAISLLAKGNVVLEVDSLRQYPYKDSFAHVLGYIGQITKEDLENPFYKQYEIDDLVGKMGIEKEYEEKLKGTDGKELFEVDANGNNIRKLGELDPIPGIDITLTLDLDLQKATFNALKDVKKGSVIVSTPKGEILTLISKPSFDPNLFTLGSSYKADEESFYKDVSSVLLDSENQPLLNRTISGTYPPGSTFKLITAVAGLENNIIDENFKVTDNGILRVGEFSFGNWYFLQYGRTDGEVDVVTAIKRSNDIFFYTLAQKIGVEKLSKMSEQFGVGRKLNIDLPGEEKGNLPTPLWKEKVIGEPWYLGDTYHYGIGQGYLLTTPLQVNIWTQALINRGQIYKPHILKNSKFKIQNSKFLSDDNFSLIRQGMIESCSPTGVAWPLFKFKVQNEKLKIDGKNFLESTEATVSAKFKEYREVSIACKTGTAQHGGEEALPHSWITLWAPAYNPQIIVTVLVESSGEGSSIAGPIAKKILEEWFSR